MKEKNLVLFSEGVQWLQHNQSFDQQDNNWLDFKNHWNGSGQPLKALFGNVTGCCSNGQNYSNAWCLFDDKKLGTRDRINLHGRFETEEKNNKTFTKTQKNTTISRSICNLLVYVTCSPKDFSPRNKNFKSKDQLSEYKLKFFSK